MPTSRLIASLEGVVGRYGDPSAAIPVMVDGKPFLISFNEIWDNTILGAVVADINGAEIFRLSVDTGRPFSTGRVKPWIVTVNGGKIYASIVAFENGVLDIFDVVVDPINKTMNASLIKQITLSWLTRWEDAFYTRIVGRMAYIPEWETGRWHMVDLINDVDYEVNTGAGTYDYEPSNIILFRTRDEAGTKIVRPLMLIGRHLAGDPYRLYDCVRFEVVETLNSYGGGSPRVQLAPMVTHDKLYLFLVNGGVIDATNYIGVVDGDTFTELFRVNVSDIVSGRNIAYAGIPLFKAGNNIYMLCGLGTLKSSPGDVGVHLLRVDLANNTITNELTIRSEAKEDSHDYVPMIFKEDFHMPGVYVNTRLKKAYFIYKVLDWTAPEIENQIEYYYLYEIDFSDVNVDEYNALVQYLQITRIPTQLTLSVLPL